MDRELRQLRFFHGRPARLAGQRRFRLEVRSLSDVVALLDRIRQQRSDSSGRLAYVGGSAASHRARVTRIDRAAPLL